MSETTDKGNKIGAAFAFSEIADHPTNEEMKTYKEVCLQISRIGDTDDDLLWDKNTGKKIGMPYQKRPRELFWSKLGESLTWQEKWAYWVVELLEQNRRSSLEEIKEVCTLLYKFCLAIKKDPSSPTPSTLDGVVRKYKEGLSVY